MHDKKHSYLPICHVYLTSSYTFINKMLLVSILILYAVETVAQNSFNMYNTNHGQDGYCLLYYVQNNSIFFNEYDLFTHQIIPYCLRPLEEDVFITTLNVKN